MNFKKMIITNKENLLEKSVIAVIGGGPAGLAVGFYAKKNDLPFVIYETAHRVGGNANTIRWGDFLFDTGAHRFHDQDPSVTREIKQLMDGELQRINAPSQIFFKNRYIDFPLSPLNLFKNLGFMSILKGGLDLVRSRLFMKSIDKNFEQYAVFKYGPTIAQDFLLDYSEKLWGLQCHRLSHHVAGKRIHGLDLKTFVLESFGRNKAKTEHLDGAFYYPTKGGIDRIASKLKDFCGDDNVKTGLEITKVFHDDSSIRAIELNHDGIIQTDQVVNTISLSKFVRMLDPPPPQEIIRLADNLRYRSMVLVALFLNLDSISPNASIYFPDPSLPFTRIYEPKNRNPLMAPKGKTSLIAEIPCFLNDKMWTEEENSLKDLVSDSLLQMGFFKRRDIIDTQIYRIREAYPILEVDYMEKIDRIMRYLDSFTNLVMTGRNGKFRYIHIHDLVGEGREIIHDFADQRQTV
ncbi:MAG: FAD-dependent oxidoreductase [Desulfatiglans sp.]|nr:FAD-dependent oxidoreductase [Thermodesulfobacteriota bacterium]MEE4352727.1 FAD-dependent oxidoreductase [Desulfatiglans sp.]